MLKIFNTSQSAPPLIQSPINSTPLRRQKQQIDTILSMHERGGSRSQHENKSLFTRIVDIFDCIQHYFVSQGKRLVRAVLRVLQHFTHSTSPVSEALRDIAGVTSELHPVHNSAITPSRPAITQQNQDMIIATEHLQDQVFECLRLTEEDMETINYILTTLATTNAFSMPSTELREKGKTINDVHPLKFLSYVFNNTEMVANLSIMKSRLWGVIWAQFIDDLGDKLTEAVKQQNFEQFIDAFSRSIHRDPLSVRAKIAEGSWSKFIDFLMEINSHDTSLSSHSSGADESFDTPPSSPQRRMDTSTQSPLLLTAGINPNEAERIVSRLSRSQSMKDHSRSPAPIDSRGRHNTTGHHIEAFFDPESSIQITDPRLLPISQEQKETIEYILSTVASTNHFILTFYTIQLKQKWATLKDLNALRILLEIFSDTTNFSNLSLIMQDSLKKKHFLEDLIKVLSKTSPGALAPYAKNFANLMNVTEQTILPFIMIGEPKSWKNLVKYLYSVQQIPLNPEQEGSEVGDVL